MRALARPSGTATETVSIPLPRLPAALNGLTIQVVADLHVRSHRSTSLRAVEELAGTRPDFLFACGDLCDAVGALPLVAQVLAAIEPIHGAYAVWGNHDLLAPPTTTDPDWIGTRTQPLLFMREALQAQGITLLNNALVHQRVNDAVLAIAGIGDATKRRDDPQRAFHQADGDVFTIAVTHNPDALLRLGPVHTDLVVCGHTHGGQIVAPMLPPLTTSTRLSLPCPSGLMHIGGRLTYVTSGIGTVGLPLRINAPAEAPLLTLVQAGAPVA